MPDAKRPLLNGPERELPMPRYEYQTRGRAALPFRTTERRKARAA